MTNEVAGSMDPKRLMPTRARAARQGARALALCATRVKNDALLQMARGLEEKAASLIAVNRVDVDRARPGGHPRALLRPRPFTGGRLAQHAPRPPPLPAPP